MAYRAEVDDRTHRVDLRQAGESLVLRIDDESREVDGRPLPDGSYSLLIDGRSYVARVATQGDVYTVSIAGRQAQIRVVDEHRTRRLERKRAEPAGGGEVRAMLSGTVVEVLVSVGDRIEPNQGLLVIEAMKMENEVKSPVAGEVKMVAVSAGQTVSTGQLLVVIGE